mmetsp:Transcript_40733/g.67366  ORF Transcript_40733/g.67366 Transcript_40733/m.67366 type:complete len:529 (+) Transcript_40733:1744-3330(+)
MQVGRGQVRQALVLHQRAVVVADDQPVARGPVGAQHRARLQLGQLAQVRLVRAHLLEVRHVALGPVGRAVRGHIAVQLVLPQLALHAAQAQGRVDRLAHLLAVPGIDAQRPGQRLRTAGKLRQNEHARALAGDEVRLLLRADVLVADQVHPVADRRHHADVGQVVDREELLLGDALVDVVHGVVLQRAVGAVDAAHQLVHLVGQALVLGHLRAAGHAHLDERDLALPLGVPLKEQLEAQQLVGHALDVVQPVHAQQDLAPLESLHQLLDAGDGGGLGQLVGDVVRVDADGVHAEGHEVVPVLDAPRGGLDLQHPGAGGEEVAGVVVGMEPHEVRAGQTLQQLVAHGQDAVDLRAWEWGVEEPADSHARRPSPQLRRKAHQVVVLHPHVAPLLLPQVALAPPGAHAADHLGEDPVGVLVRVPHAVVELLLRPGLVHWQRHVVEEGPEHIIAEAVVVQVGHFVCQEDRDAVVLLQKLRADRGLLLLSHFNAKPADPLEGHVVTGAHQCSNQPAAGHGKRPLSGSFIFFCP